MSGWERVAHLDRRWVFLGIALAVVIVFSMLAFFLARRLAVRGLTMEVKEIAPAVRPQVV